MILSDLMERLEQFCPASFAQSWDNPGLQAGDTGKEIRTVLLALDATSEVVEQAVRENADLILTHHPLIFKGIKEVSDRDFIGKRIVTMLQNGIAAYAMHTNFDVLGMADAAADELKLQEKEVLWVTFEDDVSREGIGRVGRLTEYMELKDFAVYVKETFRIPSVRVYGDPYQPVVTAAILPGSGADEIDLAVKAGADCMVTGDITHHKGIDAVEKGIAVIDAGHYGVEKLFIPYMESFLRREIPELKVLKAAEKEPFFEV